MAKFKDKKEAKTFFKLDKSKIFAITVAVVMILSTIVICAVCAVRDNGFTSMVMTFLPIFVNAKHLSPSSKGTKTTSAL